MTLGLFPPFTIKRRMTILITGFGPVSRRTVQPNRAAGHGASRAGSIQPGYAALRMSFAFPMKPSTRNCLGAASRASGPMRWSCSASPAAPSTCASRRGRAMRSTRLLPDAAGYVPATATILPEAPSTLPLRVPAQRLLMAARSAGVPAAVSRDAGRYLCNYLCWRATEAACNGGPRIAAFVHVPIVRRTDVHPGPHRRLTLDELVVAGEAIVRAALAAARRPTDLQS